MWPNFEVVEFQPRSGIAIVLDYVDYCYVRLPCLPCYSSPHRSYHTRSFAYPGVTCLRLSIPTSHSASTIPWFPLNESLPISPPTRCFLRLRQGCPKLLLCRLLPPPCAPPVTSPLVALLACAHFEYRPQRQPLCYGCLPSPYVGCHRRELCVCVCVCVYVCVCVCV